MRSLRIAAENDITPMLNLLVRGRRERSIALAAPRGPEPGVAQQPMTTTGRLRDQQAEAVEVALRRSVDPTRVHPTMEPLLRGEGFAPLRVRLGEGGRPRTPEAGTVVTLEL